eukprot:g68883.t1
MQRSLPVLLRRAARRLDTKSFSSSSSSSSSPSPPSSSRVTLGPKLPGGAPAQFRKLDKLDAETRALLDAAGMLRTQRIVSDAPSNFHSTGSEELIFSDDRGHFYLTFLDLQL